MHSLDLYAIGGKLVEVLQQVGKGNVAVEGH
jgi:hypothetical protein